MREKFREIKFNKTSKKLLDSIIEILDNFEDMGFRLTLRQLYYQLVSKDIIPNKVNEYGKLSKLLTKARMGGMIDWEIIEDRIRRPQKKGEWTSVNDILESAINQYRGDRWEDQETYLEVWIEKDALSGIVSKVTEKYHINLMVNRGYSSASAMYDASKRIQEATNLGKQCYIIYLGDLDPSGEDMVRDIEDRLTEFECMVDVIKIGLTIEQVRKLNPPPNPAKENDPRAKDYIKKYGSTSWEVDALEPKYLIKLVEKNIIKRMDLEKYEEQIVKEEIEKEEARERLGIGGD